jgi:hypothetical protein
MVGEAGKEIAGRDARRENENMPGFAEDGVGVAANSPQR